MAKQLYLGPSKIQTHIKWPTNDPKIVHNIHISQSNIGNRQNCYIPITIIYR